VERCLDRDPKGRPASAHEVLEALQRIRGEPERRSRQRTTSMLVLTALAGLGAAGWFWWASEPAPGDKLIGVVAEVRNQSGNPALDDLSRLFTTSLEQSRRLTLLSRARLSALAREAKLEQPERLDGPRARDLARLGHARVLLLPEARSEGGRLTLSVRAVDPDDEHLLFERSATVAGQAEVPGAVDQLAEVLRKKLHERREDLASGRIQLASAISPNLDAARAYFQGIDCWMKPSDRTENVVLACPPFFQAALAADPSFALAHHWLARSAFLPGNSPDEARTHVAAAMAAVGRLPAREALLVRSWAAHVEGRSAEAEALADEAVARYPDDLEALDQAVTLRRDRGDLAGAIPFVERQVSLEPDSGEAQVELVALLQGLDRREELARLARQLELKPASPAVDRALVQAYLGLGRAEDAVGRARARHEQLGTTVTRGLLWGAYEKAGHFAEVEQIIRTDLADHPERQHTRFGLAAALAAQGRLREALREIDEAEYQTKALGSGSAAYLRAVVLTLGKDEAALQGAATMAHAADPPLFSCLATALALRGHLPLAERLAVDLPSGPARAQYAAVRAWRTGHPAEAIGALKRQLETGVEPPGAFHPAYLLAEVSLASDDPAGALSAIDRYRRSRVRGYWGVTTWMRCRLLAARAHLTLGHRDEARLELDRLLAELKRADPDLPVLGEARALRSTLGAR